MSDGAVSTIKTRIGVHLSSAEQGLMTTLSALWETTDQAFEIVVLIDPAPGEAAAVDQLVSNLRQVPLWRAPSPGGAAACFNQLIARPADIYVFLEAGARPGPEWLSRLSQALEAPTHGLAGPSTNLCWNEQAASPRCGSAALDIEREVWALERLHGDAVQSMAPLHSLSDFCLAVRADVVAAVGGADTAYGRGPCWEMDYAARASRAGFESVWVKAAFVRRTAMSTTRAALEPDLLEVSKRLYQDRFCGRRAPGDDYHGHCRGDACADFAPVATTQVRLPLPSAAEEAVSSDEAPLISCIMPTRGRARYVAQAIAYFRRQDYPNKELIIVYDGDGDLPPEAVGPEIRTLRATQTSIGGKRNEGLRIARGEIVAQWDDDDWYGVERLSRQARPILQGLADVTGLTDILFLEAKAQTFWSVSRALFRRLFVENVHGGTLMFRREIWRRDGPYPATSLREDADFLVRVMQKGARLCRLPGRDLWIYVRHEHNTWQFGTGQYLNQGEWFKAAEPSRFSADRTFYFDKAETPAPPRRKASANDLVSCIMPTANRREFVPAAIRQFLAQDHRGSELIVIDDGEDSIADLIPASDRIRYRRFEHRATIGAKRNLACDMARGEVILHWDDDDWRASGWISSQVRALGDADLGGLDKIYFHEPETGRAWRYVYDGGTPWVYGGTLCYAKDLWRRRPFDDRNVGEDNAFVWSREAKRLVVNSDHDLFVATIHRRNTSPKDTAQRRWRALPPAQLERTMREPDSLVEAPAPKASAGRR